MNISFAHPKVRFWWRWWGPKWEKKDGAFKGRCHNSSFVLVTKAKARKGVGRKCNSGITFALLGVWGNKPTHSQMDSHFGSWKPYGISNLQKGNLKVKFIGLQSFLYHWKNLEILLFKMSSHDPFEYLKHKLWPKEGSKIKVSIWLLPIKN